MAIMKFFPKIPKIGRIIPASLVGLLVGTLLEHTLFRMVFGVATRTVNETAEMSGSLPKFDWPTVPTDGKTIGVIINYAITLAAIGAVESVLTLQACNEITDTGKIFCSEWNNVFLTNRLYCVQFPRFRIRTRRFLPKDWPIWCVDCFALWVVML